MTRYPDPILSPSLGREIGIMIAVLGACVLTIGIYSIIWRRIQIRNQAEDLDRRKALKNRAARGPDFPSTAPAATAAAPERRIGLDTGGVYRLPMEVSGKKSEMEGGHDGSADRNGKGNENAAAARRRADLL
ncbi:hypothetical protein N7539_003606 [Penicillium diatomitis]|uniref:Uncharacterized protein n=1 Tax=Penicillium diatomitis TaxID=2819901 RepID=A0A9W9XCM5_9EURO|nr:uncharacterized protein N7539_003606 [Penicillium diatomitis]KAJ5488716.1 hypothetical protein N7539_003606 [Penicillium diatomitis]